MASVALARKRKKSRRAPFKPVKYTVTDGKLVLVLETCEEGGYCVTCPFDPGLVTQGETLEECFEMASDAAELLQECRNEMSRETRRAVRAKSKKG